MAETFDTIFFAAWQLVSQTPGVLRNTAFGETKRRGIGMSGSVVQFNQEHIRTKRPASTAAASPTVAAIPVSQPFNFEKFHFLKCKPTEIIVKIRLDGTPDVSYAAHVGRLLPEDSHLAEHPWFINANPLLPGHGLLTPFAHECRPQIMNSSCLEVGVRAAALSTRDDLRIGFNSLGAWASVNHFHLHTFYVRDVFGAGKMPIETDIGSVVHAAALPVGSHSLLVQVNDLGSWPLQGFSVTTNFPPTLEPAAVGAAIRAFVGVIGGFCMRLVKLDIPHNLLICEHGTRVIVIPRQAQRGGGAEVLELAVALAESCGLAIVYTQEAFESLTQDQFFATLKEFSVAPETWEALANEWKLLLDHGAGPVPPELCGE
jgi:hypothetical protein